MWSYAASPEISPLSMRDRGGVEQRVALRSRDRRRRRDDRRER